MKRLNFRIIVSSCLAMVIACCIGMHSASALSLSDFVESVIGSDISSMVDSFFPSTEQTTAENVYPGGENDLDGLLERLGIVSDITRMTDLIRHLNMGGSFESWVYDNYGSEIEIPESVKNMPPQELIMYILGSALNPSENTTTGEYVFAPSETETQTDAETQTVTESGAEITSAEYTTEESVSSTAAGYITGDVNGDGKVTASDARLVLRVSSRIEEIDGAAFLAADVNGDNRITAKDARSILRYSAKITGTF